MLAQTRRRVALNPLDALGDVDQTGLWLLFPTMTTLICLRPAGKHLLRQRPLQPAGEGHAGQRVNGASDRGGRVQRLHGGCVRSAWRQEGPVRNLRGVPVHTPTLQRRAASQSDSLRQRHQRLALQVGDGEPCHTGNATGGKTETAGLLSR
jgi:hypothetical protein